MSEVKQRLRNPKFPFIGLAKALKRAEELYQQERRAPANIKVVVRHWGFSESSSGGLQTIAALKAFGLIESDGKSAQRAIRLSDLALRIILDTREGSQERAKATQEAALKPKLHTMLWRKHDRELPSDESLRHELIFDYGFNELSVDRPVKVFRETLDFAKLLGSDTISEEEDNSEDIFNSNEPTTRTVSTLQHHREVLALPRGAITIQWPASLSRADVSDFEAWLDSIKRRVKRFAQSEDEESQGPLSTKGALVTK